MQRHMPSHTKEKPFVCDVCGASFASHTGHRAHMRKHTGRKETKKDYDVYSYEDKSAAPTQSWNLWSPRKLKKRT